VIAGFNGHGIMHGPALARACAERIARGSTSIISLETLDPDRFRHGTESMLERINLL
jgi:glycine/D-amino acid oxidase-like deaminating enzyme